MSLMREIREYPVPQASVGIWWFGQNGFLFKTPEGTLASVDLYLTDSCANLVPGFNLSRKVPVILPPEEVEVDLFTCTHSHQDHTDPETIRALRNKDTACFLGPHQSCDVFRDLKIESGRTLLAWPKCEIEFRDVTVHGMFALPTDDSDLNHMGFVLEFGTGPRVYVTGDTDFCELLYAAQKWKPDVLITCINGGFNNLSHWEAAQLAGRVGAKIAIPCHYDMFPDNSVDPKQFQAAMRLQAPEVGYQEMRHGEPLLFSR
jgi:L-ascorbate 6-phosphate lactonase